MAGKVNDLVARGVPRQIAFRSRALSLDEHLQSATNVRSINAFLILALRCFELEKAGRLFLLRYAVAEIRGRRSGALRVFKDVKTVVLAFLHELERLAKVFVGFTRKPDDDVAGQREPAAGVLDALDSLP